MAQTGNLSIITEILDHSNSQPGFPAKTQKKKNKQKNYTATNKD